MKMRVHEALRSITGTICLGALLFCGCVSVDGMRENLKTSTGDDLKDAQEELCSIVAGHSLADPLNGDTFEDKLQFLNLAEGDQQLLLKMLFKLIERNKHDRKCLKTHYGEEKQQKMLSYILERLDVKSPEVVKGLLDFTYEASGFKGSYSKYASILYEKLAQCDLYDKNIKDHILNRLNTQKYTGRLPLNFFQVLFKGISLTDDKAFWACYFQGAPYTAIEKYFALASLDGLIDFYMMFEKGNPWSSNRSRSSDVSFNLIAIDLSWTPYLEGEGNHFQVQYKNDWPYAEEYPSSEARELEYANQQNRYFDIQYTLGERLRKLNVIEIDDETLLKVLYFVKVTTPRCYSEEVERMVKEAKQEWIKRKWDKNSATLKKMLSSAITQKESKKKLGQIIALLKRYDSSMNTFKDSLTLTMELPLYQKTKRDSTGSVNINREDLYLDFKAIINDQLHKLFAESSLKLTDAELATLFCRDARFYSLLNKLVTSNAMYLALKSNKLAKDLELKLVESIEPVKIDMVLYNSVKDANIKKALYKRMPRANREAMDKRILAKIRKDAQKASATTFVLDGFYLGMPIEDAKLVFEYTFPNISIKEDVRDEKKELSIDGQDSPFCLAKEDGKVYQFDFGRRLLEKWYKYQTQDVTMWSLKYGEEHRLGFSAETKEELDRFCFINMLGMAIHGSWFASVLEHKNYDKAYKLTLFVSERYVLDTPTAKSSLKETLRGVRAEGGTLRVEKMKN